MKAADRILQSLSRGPQSVSELSELLGIKAGTVSKALSGLAKDGEVVRVSHGVYALKSDSGTPNSVFPEENGTEEVSELLSEKRENLTKIIRTAEDNERTINILMNTYDEVLSLFQMWILQNVSQNIDFEKQLLFIENFKWLTAIADKLMKRWALVHIGYDTNTRQAQEDAKAKTEERHKQVLADAPIEDKIVVVGHYQEGMQEILKNLPKKDLEDSKV